MMLDHIIGVDEASENWDLSTEQIEKMCMDGQVVSKKIGDTWVIFRDQKKPSAGNEAYVQELASKIEWDLLSPQERRAILDENTRVFNKKVNILRLFRAKGFEGDELREVFPDLSDAEYQEIKEVSEHPDK